MVSSDNRPPVSVGVSEHLTMLTPAQLAHMHTFGYLVLRSLLTADEAERLGREAADIMAAQGVDIPGRGQVLQPFFERGPFLSQLPADDRIYALGEDLLGPDFFLDGTEGNLHAADTPWHGGKGRQTRLLPEIKIAFYTQPLTRETGCLRVIPGTHRVADPDLFSILRNRGEDPEFRPFGLPPEEVPCTALVTEPGDVVVFHEDLLHASFGGQAERHQHAINFVSHPRTEEQHALLRELYEQQRFGFHPAESYINSQNPRLRRMVALLVELGFETSKV
jgi:hypothetical protein